MKRGHVRSGLLLVGLHEITTPEIKLRNDTYHLLFTVDHEIGLCSLFFCKRISYARPVWVWCEAEAKGHYCQTLTENPSGFGWRD